MTAVQLNAMHTQLLQNIGYIADDEALMRRLTAYSKKLAKEKASDPTLMTKEEYYAMLDEAEQQLKRGDGCRVPFLPRDHPRRPRPEGRQVIS